MSPENQIRLELLRSAPLNAWIALSEDESRIVAIANNYSDVARKADEAGEPEAIIVKTPPVWATLAV